MTKDQYMNRYPQLIKKLKKILEKSRYLKEQESEESKIAELNMISEYIEEELGMKMPKLALNIESVWEHGCINKEEHENLKKLYFELLEHRENQVYLRKSFILVKKMKSVIAKCSDLGITEMKEDRDLFIEQIYEYIRKLFKANISEFYVKVESTREYKCISKEEKEMLDTLYQELIKCQEKYGSSEKRIISPKNKRDLDDLTLKIKQLIAKCKLLEEKEEKSLIIKEVYKYIREELEMSLSLFYSKVDSLYKKEYINEIEKEVLDTLYQDLTECQQNENYLRKYNEEIKMIKQVIEKTESKEIEEVYDYIKKEIGINISVFYIKVEAAYEHKCISKKEKEKLDALHSGLTAHQKKLIYLKKNSDLIKNILDIIEKSKVLKIDELYDYIEEKSLTLSQIKSSIQNLYKYSCINKDIKDQFDRKYERLLNYDYDKKEIRKKERYNKRYIEMINNLIELSNQKKGSSSELDEYIKRNFSCSISALKLRIKTASEYNSLTKEQIKSLIYICEAVEIYRKNNRKPPVYKISTEKIENATIMIEEFIESGKSLSEYCQENNISSHKLSEYLRFISKYNRVLYERYIIYLEFRKEYIEKIVSTTSNDILDKIENGIMLQDHSIKKFDIIDYYLLTGILLDEYAKTFKKKANDLYEIRAFFQFYNNNFDQKISVKEIKGILDCTLIRNGIEITEDMKIEIFSYLKNHMIPITNITFRVAIDRYLNNTLFEQQNYTYNRKVG